MFANMLPPFAAQGVRLRRKFARSPPGVQAPRSPSGETEPHSASQAKRSVIQNILCPSQRKKDTRRCPLAQGFESRRCDAKPRGFRLCYAPRSVAALTQLCWDTGTSFTTAPLRVLLIQSLPKQKGRLLANLGQKDSDPLLASLGMQAAPTKQNVADHGRLVRVFSFPLSLPKQKRPPIGDLFCFGRGRRTRTHDPWFWRPVLYQLSYTPVQRDTLYHTSSKKARGFSKKVPLFLFLAFLYARQEKIPLFWCIKHLDIRKNI